MLKQLLEDIQTTFNILKIYIYKLKLENKKLKEQIKMFHTDIDEIIENNKK